ncbi:MAG: hypothetical protein ACK5MF_12665, partial [Vibrio sp.]|uniref:hypothetical protein n=1 Tax=Vibrio sp. TaxID=678 RepID=UPI003A8807B7
VTFNRCFKEYVFLRAETVNAFSLFDEIAAASTPRAFLRQRSPHVNTPVLLLTLPGSSHHQIWVAFAGSSSLE